jgi:hypothetical protein
MADSNAFAVTQVSAWRHLKRRRLPRVLGAHGAGVESSIAPRIRRSSAKWSSRIADCAYPRLAACYLPIHREHAVAAKPTAQPNSVTSRWQ